MGFARFIPLALIAGVPLWHAPGASASNPWRELSSGIQGALAPLLSPDPAYYPTALSNWDFRLWYKRHYCPALADSQSSCPTAGAAAPESAYPEFAYNQLPIERRVSLACVMTRISEEGPLLPGIGAIKFAGDQGVVGFHPTGGGGTSVRSGLLERGYGEWQGAAFGSNRVWGLRSPRVGAYLHWSEGTDGTINVHIDLNNPGSPAAHSSDAGPSRDEWDVNMSGVATLGAGLRHRELDLDGRAATHTPLGIVAAFVPDACGIGASDLTGVAASATGGMRTTLLAIASTRCPP